MKFCLIFTDFYNIGIQEAGNGCQKITSCLQDVEELLSLRELGDLDKCLLHITAGSAHNTHSQEQIVSPEEVSRQPGKTRVHIYTCQAHL